MAITGFPEIETDDGHQTIIYTTKAGGDHPIHGAIFFGGIYEWLPASWTLTGFRIRDNHICDLSITKAIASGQVQI